MMLNLSGALILSAARKPVRARLTPFVGLSMCCLFLTHNNTEQLMMKSTIRMVTTGHIAIVNQM
ncbi:hypothetical protein C2845_PM05G10990 [Panicum miliaceum]|uniref:Uncharacterized protein n=1 Tax=Panicum miliaceum TaxID=4540 RepID=A0A3L6SZ84_PANMI|nr:hypothetical protein C2845_PM05G10990 [Panicum miliaceum]